MLFRELLKFEDDFITVEINNKEYVMEKIVHKQNYSDSPSTHICIVCRDGGDGEIKR